jgi:hypothetical protein
LAGPAEEATKETPTAPTSAVGDRDQLEEAVRVGYERGRASLKGYDASG